MDDVICWYDETLVRVMGLREVEDGPCYRVADGVYVDSASFEVLFGTAAEQTAWMLLRSGDMTGELERWAPLVSNHWKDDVWLERTLESEFIDTGLAPCYFTEL